MPLMLEIPDSAVAALQLPPDKLRDELRRDLAVVLYAGGALPVGKAMEFAGLSRGEFEAMLKAGGVRRPLDRQDLERELA
jgi:predicted HTH domain antitoxin